MAELVLDYDKFRLSYPAFANETRWPDDNLQRKYALAQRFISEGCTLNGDDYVTAIEMLTAHLLWNEKLLLDGQTTVGIVTGATISKVTVSLQAPPARTAWQFWLSTSPYGLELWAFLMMLAAGGWYIGGLPERKAFRKVGGTFR